MPWFNLFVKALPPSAMDRARQIAAEQRAAEEERRRREGLKSKAKPGDGGIGSNPDTGIPRRPIGVRSGSAEWGMCWLYRQDLNLLPEENRATHYRVTCFTADGTRSATIDRTTQSKRQFWDNYYTLPVTNDTFLLLIIEDAGDDIVFNQVAERAFYVGPDFADVIIVAEGLRQSLIGFYNDTSYGYADVSWWRSDVSGLGPYDPISLFQSAAVYGDASIYQSMDSTITRNTAGLTPASFGAPKRYRASHDARSLFVVQPSGDTADVAPALEGSYEEASYARFLRLPLEQTPDESGAQRLLMVDTAGLPEDSTWGASATSYRVSIARDPEDFAEEVGALGGYTRDGSLAWGSQISIEGGTYWSCLAYSGDKYAIIIHWEETILENGNPGPINRLDPPRCVNIQLATGNARYESPVQLTGINRYLYSYGDFTPCFCTGWDLDWTAKLGEYGQVFE